MALEVNEIGIRLRVDGGEEEGDEESGRAAPGTCAERLDRDEIVGDCVRRVLQALTAQRER